MAWATYNPYRDLEMLRHEIDRLFDGGPAAGRWSGPFSRVSFLPGRQARAYPLMNFNEDDNNLYAEALAPGIDPQSLKLSVVGDQLTLAGEKVGPQDVKSDAWHRNERATGRFTRTVTLPYPVDADKVTADYRDGVLKITLPKAEAARPKQIEVNVG